MTATENESQSGGPAESPGEDKAATKVWLLVLVMAALALLLTFPYLSTPDGAPDPKWWLLLPLFGLAEAIVIHLPTLRHAHSHTLREIPAIAGLAFLPPSQYLAAYVLGSAVALVVVRRQRGVKLAFNISMFALEAAVGLLVYHSVLGPAHPADPRGWAAALTAVLVTDLLSAGAVTGAISLSEGRYDGTVLKEALRSGLLAAMVNTATAVLVVVLAFKNPVALPLLSVVVVILIVAYRSYVNLWGWYSRLELLYRFVRTSEAPVDLEGTYTTLLVGTRDLLGAEQAELVLMPGADVPGHRVRVMRDRPPETSAFTAPDFSDAWWAPAALGEPVLHARRSRGERLRAGHLRTAAPSTALPSGPREGMAVPLRENGQVTGILLVTERTFEEQTFTSEDLRLLETLAGHSSVALERAGLVDHLRRLASRREHEARHDALTGLLNRNGLHEVISALDVSTDRAAILLADLDEFKDVNDTLGHPAGDALLREMAARLSILAPTVARLGGDEFAILSTGAQDLDLVELAQTVLETITQPARLFDADIHVTASIGIALFPEHAQSGDDLLRHADVAMYAAKSQRAGVALYRPEDGQATHRRLKLAGDLHAAIAQHHFQLYFQPQVSATTSELVGGEALLRWRHPQYGDVPPQEMIALAERTGLLRRLTDAVLEDALHQRAAWAAHGFDLTVSVNVTTRDLFDEDLPRVVERLLATTSTEPSLLTVEITESGVMRDPDRCLAVLHGIHALGVRISVDDFGTGHSSLTYLERLPLQELKIDKSFVDRLESDTPDATVIRSTIALAHDLGLTVVAEGVQTAATGSRLAALGCEILQGYAISQPLPANETVSWIRRRAAESRVHRA